MAMRCRPFPAGGATGTVRTGRPWRPPGEMALLLTILHTLVFIALLSLVGQFAVGLFAWKRRHDNVVFQMLGLATRPLIVALRRILPRRWSGAQVSVAAFVLLCCGYLGVGFLQRAACLPDLNQPGCEKWQAVRAGQPH